MTNIEFYRIGKSNNDDKFFVYESIGDGEILYRGTYTECLIVVGGLNLHPNMTLTEILNLCKQDN